MAHEEAELAETTKVWKAMSLVAALLGATIARKALNTFWHKATGKQPPSNPADPDVDMWEAVAWAAASGTAVAMARMLASRRAANYYIKSTGKVPDELRRDVEVPDKG